MANQEAAVIHHEKPIHLLDDYEMEELAGEDFSSEADEAPRGAEDFEKELDMTGFYLQHDFNYFDL